MLWPGNREVPMSFTVYLFLSFGGGGIELYFFGGGRGGVLRNWQVFSVGVL